MSERRHVRVVICSGGRRVYLVRWFREAFATLGVTGEVVVLDADPGAAAGSAADVFRVVPRLDDPSYGPTLAQVVTELDADLVLSIHDYELEVLASGLAAELRRGRTAVLALDAQAQLVAGDKLLLAERIDPSHRTPTVKGSDVRAVDELRRTADTLVVKHRYGSGSSGLSVVTGDRVDDAIARAAVDAPRPSTAPATDTPEDWVVVQPRLQGVEYGLDVVFGVHGSATGLPAGVAARRKLAMRGGETDRAVTVSAEPFGDVAAAVGALLHPRGTVDVDVIVDEDGRQRVIDVNPRFGGGYPFSHMAGVDIPAFLVADLLGADSPEVHLRGAVGVMSAKHEEIRVVHQEGPTA